MSSRRVSFLLVPLLLATSPAAAQLSRSDAHKFLDAIKNEKAQDVTDMLATPGNTLINTQDPGTGDTALHMVVKRGDVTYTRFLLQHGADPNVRNKQGQTPAMLAVDENEEPCLQALIAGKADLNVGNDRGETPLIRAVQMRNAAMVQDLLKGGADPDQTDHMAGLSARDYAKRDSRSPIIAKLLADAPKVHKAPQIGPSL
ncbi:ankyrin repeat domain-containing protein [Hephaestia mangrovi]|uniref:ankyrin repeat domain-containing protein n=1 Tax=Hephaestia mangrovi TaxID=2873268 RepID=UPI001CA6D985|nr:ankyrin repeat domain-containing protein [Hephaestia mangrovi]MBY8829091.1 ankyrin repeat domain-containing protein [Hephaestia mangrovi]